MDITQVILDDHAEQRRLFSMLEQIGSDPKDALSAVWHRLSTLLDTHAEAEEQIFYPVLLRLSQGPSSEHDPEEETEDAIRDHNDIRDAVEAVAQHEVGSEDWMRAVTAANKANSDHMAEEEREGLTEVREQVSLEDRHELAVRFVAFEFDHLTGVDPVDKDPDQYIADNKPS